MPAEQRIRHTGRRASWYITRTIRSRFFPVLEPRSVRYWAGSRGRFAGRAGFVLGNGPSLQVDRLNELSDFITLAANRIDLAYDRTSFRPRFVTICDPQIAGRMAPYAQMHHDRVFVGPDVLAPITGARRITWRHLGRPVSSPGDSPLFSADAELGLYAGYSVTYTNLQIAAHFGLDPIFLLGCDHLYEGEAGAHPKSLIRAGEKRNHFDDRYRSSGELVRPAPIGMMTTALEHARAWADGQGRRILNASEGGCLDVFDRVSLDDAIGMALDQRSDDSRMVGR